MSLITATSRTSRRTICSIKVKLWCHHHYYSTLPRIEQHDLVVVGGGPAGLALTAGLLSSESITKTHKITLLESNSLDSTKDWLPPKPKGELSNRVSSITKENRDWLEEIGVWNFIEKTRVRNINHMQVWDGLSDARIQFDSPDRDSPMATLTENLNLQRACLKRIEQLQQLDRNVELIDQMKVEQITTHGDGDGDGWPLIHLKNRDGTIKRILKARLLIGADGVNSPVKLYSDIETFGWNYDRQGLVTSLNLKSSRGTFTAWQRFLPLGPIALLPLSDTTASLVWSTSPQQAQLFKRLPPRALSVLINLGFCLPYPQLSKLLSTLEEKNQDSWIEEEELVESLQNIHQQHLESIYNPNDQQEVLTLLPPLVESIQSNGSSSTASFPLKLSHTSSYLGLPRKGKDLRTILIGDACHTIHPLAGQGLNMGLNDSSCLISILSKNSNLGIDLGSYISLLEYPKKRYFKNHLLLSTCDHLNSLYKFENSLLVSLRSNGLEVLNEFDGIKKLLMGNAGATTTTTRGGGGSGSSSGGWELIGNGFETFGKLKDFVGMFAGLAQNVVKKRATDFIVK
jgi:ubiquinone biosynthesis monooxygenase Coq6